MVNFWPLVCKKALATRALNTVNLPLPVGLVGGVKIRLENTVNESMLKIASPEYRLLTLI
jgi:hypothetical protein